MKALNDPSSDLTQQLLASDELEKQRIEPWWEADDPDIDAAPEFDPVGGPSAQKHFGTKPKMMNIPETVVSASTKSLNQGPPLLYNIAATLQVPFSFEVLFNSLIHFPFTVLSTPIPLVSSPPPPYLQSTLATLTFQKPVKPSPNSFPSLSTRNLQPYYPTSPLSLLTYGRDSNL